MGCSRQQGAAGGHGEVQPSLMRLQALAGSFLSDNDSDPQPVEREAPVARGGRHGS